MIDVELEARPIVERAVLVGIQNPADDAGTVWEHLDELESLAGNLDIVTVNKVVIKLREVQSQYYVGRGKAEEIAIAFQQQEADLLIFDDELTPSQQRNWERLTKGRVIDRQEVILDIFAARASTKEAVLQVELAQLQYFLPRLTRAWSHLSRQRGGAKGTRGEGEKQLENDRRQVEMKISNLKRELQQITKQRKTQRKLRQRNSMAHAAIVGYTNAGKSSLLNALTSAGVLTEDKLFATLDPTTRKLELPNNQTLLLTDTVGFVRKLPHSLVDAFKSTLEEAVQADFLILVLDVSNAHFEEHWDTTLQVLRELGADEKNTLVVFNKMDLNPDPLLIARARSLFFDGVFVSVKTGDGLMELKDRLCDLAARKITLWQLALPPARHDLVALAHAKGQVLECKYEDDGTVQLLVNLPEYLQNNFVQFRQETR